MNSHFYVTTDLPGLCLKHVMNGWKYEKECCNVFGRQQNDETPLYTAFSPDLSAIYYSTQVMDVDFCLYTQVAANFTRGAKYFPTKIVAYFPPQPPLAETVPVFVMFNDRNNDFLLTTNSGQLPELEADGYAQVSPSRVLSGQEDPDGTPATPYVYVYSRQTNEAMIPVYQLLSLEHHFYTADEAQRSILLRFGAVDQGVIGYVYPPPTGPAPFYASISPTGAFFYTMDLTEHYNAISSLGHRGQGIACYCYPPSQPQPQNTLPLYRMYYKDQDDHFYTTDETERDAYLDLYVCEGIAAYVYPADSNEGIPLLRFFGPSSVNVATAAGIGSVPGACPGP